MSPELEIGRATGELLRGEAQSEYLSRRTARQKTLSDHTRADLTVSHARTVTALCAILLAWLAFGRHALQGWWLFAPALIFLVLMVVHERILQRKQRAERAVSYYDAGLRRMEDRWIGRGNTRTDFAPVDHPYAADLDLFGRGSLFDLICRAQTRAGQDSLAGWFLAAADIPEILDRQQAVTELKARLDFREELYLLAEEATIDGSALAAWGEAPQLPIPPWAKPAAVLLAIAGVASALAWWPLHVGPVPLIVDLIIGQAFLFWIRKPLSRALRGVDRSVGELEALNALLDRVERESCSSPMLSRLQNELRAGGVAPSAQISRLRRLLEWLNLQASLYFAPFARLLLWSVHFAFAIESWRSVNGGRLRTWLRVVGELEAFSSLASHAYERPETIFPQFAERAPCFIAEGLAHPLLPKEGTVPNDVSMGEDIRLYIVSGSNMSGKSTLLRTIGVNTVMALAGGTVRATRLRLSSLQIGASLRTQDSLQGGVSRFYAEILRLRQIVGLAPQEPPLLFLLDEILHGTNSHDRLIGGEAIARSLVGQGAIGLITTHDLALARIDADKALQVCNIHFEDQLIDGKMSFDYHLRAGVVNKSNALELMRAVGLDV